MLRAFVFFLTISSTFLIAAEDPLKSHPPAVKAKLEVDFKVPLGLEPIPWPEDNPYSKEKAELGLLLYFDKRLSADNTVSCSTCHNIPCAYSDCKVIAIGIDERKGTRHSPTIINAGYSKLLFWDGRANSLEEQCKGPIANPNEMADSKDAHVAHDQCENRISKIEGYKPLFKKAFGDDKITIDRIAQAIATFERTVVSGNSPYDRYKAGDKTAMTEEQIKGYQVFKTVRCEACHAGFNFTDDSFQNIGIGMDKPNPDLGRYSITHKNSMWGSFKVPTLRESAHSGPYMHDGCLQTIEDVIDYYDKGGIPNKNLHPLMKPLHLSAEDKKALISFIKALDGEGWQHFDEPNEYPQ
ncbi:MAG: cytochrome c peroxidase [Parachlamydiales bacterium]|jgi:cytochrome c peroxidase